ncbi:MAG: glycoside hydrolase family 3 protein [candidate division Zixibacteria bacterium]|nr:glycoside hydrolase family 3 protein [candidate division Zixibacteria bacterium]
MSFAEDTPTDEALHFIEDNKIAGVILFANHCRDSKSLKHWLADLKKSVHRPFIVAVDQEGGRVRRFRRNFPLLESPRYYGYHDRIDEYRSDLARTCEKLYEIGINLNLAPTLDLFDSGEKHVLDTRTFSDDVNTVIKFAEITMSIHHEQGLCCCAKHFPGLGRTTGDPHQVLSAADLTEKDFFDRELKPYGEMVKSGIESVMVTHISLPKIDDAPSLISSRIISGWLKDELGFKGAVITDDLLMEGAGQIDPTPSLAGKSFNAGADFLLFGQKLKKADEMLERFSQMIEENLISGDRLADAKSRTDVFLKLLQN